MKSVVVTGGSGKAGGAAIKDLLAHGYAVMNVDIAPPREQICHYLKADLTDMGQAVDAIRRAAGTVDRRRSPLGEARPSCIWPEFRRPASLPTR
jgi:nucleoside-diphosphate-sugar epimerase